MARKMKSLTTYVTPEQYEALNELSKHTRVPKAVYLRDAIDVVLKVQAERMEAPSVFGPGPN